MSIIKHLLELNDYKHFSLEYEEEYEIKSFSIKSYAKSNCLYLISDIKKIEKENNLILKNILEDALVFCFNKEIKKPRIKIENNKIILFSQKYNYNIYLKTYRLS